LSTHRFDHNGYGRLAARHRRREDHRSAVTAPSAFHDPECLPTDDAVRDVLGNAYVTWARLPGVVAERVGLVSEIWKYTSANTGWGLRVLQRDRVILYMTPQPRQFIVSFALGERAVAAARTAKLSAPVLDAIEDAPRYAEGRGVRITVRDSRDIRALTQLAQIKCELSR
jgi:uncharacterized protein DUF3788